MRIKKQENKVGSSKQTNQPEPNMTNTLRTQIAQAQTLLAKNGWTKACSIMHDGGATGNFGIVYRKNGETIYLNFKTVDAILAQ